MSDDDFKIRLRSGPAWDDDDGWAPAVPSEHDKLLTELSSYPAEVRWAIRALITCVEGVRDGAGIEPIAVVDAWTEDEHTLCLIYTPPWAQGLAGIRRQRGDVDPIVQVIPGADRADYRSVDDPHAFGLQLLDDISEPLGAMHEHLRYDSEGTGWWGTLDATLPRRSA